MDIKSMLTIAATALLLAAPETFSQPPADDDKFNSDGQERMFADLKLSDEQKKELKSLHSEMQATRKGHMEEVKKVREKIKVELLKPEPSQKILYGYADELGALHAQMGRENGDHLLKVKKVLSPEQFTKLVEHDNKMRFGKGFRDGRRGKCPHMKDGQKPGNCPRGAEKDEQ